MQPTQKIYIWKTLCFEIIELKSFNSNKNAFIKASLFLIIFDNYVIYNIICFQYNRI